MPMEKAVFDTITMTKANDIPFGTPEFLMSGLDFSNVDTHFFDQSPEKLRKILNMPPGSAQSRSESVKSIEMGRIGLPPGLVSNTTTSIPSLPGSVPGLNDNEMENLGFCVDDDLGSLLDAMVPPLPLKADNLNDPNRMSELTDFQRSLLMVPASGQVQERKRNVEVKRPRLTSLFDDETILTRDQMFFGEGQGIINIEDQSRDVMMGLEENIAQKFQTICAIGTNRIIQDPAWYQESMQLHRLEQHRNTALSDVATNDPSSGVYFESDFVDFNVPIAEEATNEDNEIIPWTRTDNELTKKRQSKSTEAKALESKRLHHSTSQSTRSTSFFQDGSIASYEAQRESVSFLSYIEGLMKGKDESIALDDLVPPHQSKRVAARALYNILELTCQGMIKAAQKEPFGSINVQIIN